MNNHYETMVTVREFIRQPFTLLGGYPRVLFMSDGECLCRQCAKDNYRLISEATRDRDCSGWCAELVDVYWEGPVMNCAHCGADIESAYGDPAEQD